MPAFAADGRSLFYVISRSFGHSSPIAAPRRHDFDVMKITIDPDRTIAGAVPIELTQSYFRDLYSLSVSPDGEQFMVSTSGYPIGSLIEEFRIDHPLRQHRIFQPHVAGEPSGGPSFGQARYVGDGMEIVLNRLQRLERDPLGFGLQFDITEELFEVNASCLLDLLFIQIGSVTLDGRGSFRTSLPEKETCPACNQEQYKHKE